MHGGRHGDDERKVFDELCEIVEEVIEIIKADGDPLPPRRLGSGRRWLRFLKRPNRTEL
jgi:hypothetical protein